MKVDAENIDLTARTKFTWGARNIDITASELLDLKGKIILAKATDAMALDGGGEFHAKATGEVDLKSTTGDVAVEATKGSVTVSGQAAAATPGAGDGVQIKHLNTQHSTYTGAPGGWAKLSSTVPGFVPQRLLRQSGSSGSLSRIGGFTGPCGVGTSETFSSTHGWQRKEGAISHDDADFIYVHSLTATRTSPTQTDIQVQRQHVRFRAYLKPWAGWAMKAMSERHLSDAGNPGTHSKGSAGIQGELIGGCVSPP